MFSALTESVLQNVTVVAAMVDSHDAHCNQIPPEQRRRFRAFAVSACVTRLYAVYENFVESIIGDYLDSLPELVPFADLPDGVRKEYRIGFSSVLSKLDQARYSNLNHANMVQWYSQAITGDAKYKFVVQAFTRHDDNLRLSAVAAMAARVGLLDLRGWLAAHPSILGLYEDQNSVYERLEAELKDFVQMRNDAAHGSALDDLMGKEILHRYCELISALISGISSYLHKELLSKKQDCGKMALLGTITEVLRGPRAGILTLNRESSLTVGTKIHMVGQNFCYSEVVKSLQVDDQSIESISAWPQPLEVGYQGTLLPRRSAEVFVEKL